MSDGRWRITVTAPDWGQDHLSAEAVVAFVDGELAPGPHQRAIGHLARCGECAEQVRAQGQARSALRAARCPGLSSALLRSLRAIPQDAELPGPPPGLAVTADGRLVTIVRPEHDGPPGDPTPSTATPPADPPPVLGAAGQHFPAALPGPDRRPSGARRRRLGTGVAVSGLALGALALGMPAAAPSGPPVPAPAQGVPGGVGPGGGSALTGVGLGGGSSVLDARLRIRPGAGPTLRHASDAGPR